MRLITSTSIHSGIEVIDYSDVITCAMASQVISLTIVCSTVYSVADQRKHQSSASLAFVRGIHRGEFSAQRVSNAESGSISWRHHVNVSERRPED